MPTNITQLKIFIASPGGLEKERRAFKNEIDTYNEQEAIEREVLFRAIGWEETLGGIGRPQAIINEDLIKCDFFIMVLHDRWGSDPGENDKGATSGTHEEFLVALDCYAKEEYPMKQVIVLFKSVPPNQLSDPGSELKKVLEFKEEIEVGRKLLYKTFSSKREFKDLVRNNLSLWLRNSKGNFLVEEEVASSTEQLQVSSSFEGKEEDISELVLSSETDKKSKELIDKAWELAKEGKLTQAEILFSKALTRSGKPYQLIQYASFLRRIGRLDQALSMLEDALEFSSDMADEQSESSVLSSLGLILQTRGDLDGAEEMLKKSLKLIENKGFYQLVAQIQAFLDDIKQEQNKN